MAIQLSVPREKTPHHLTGLDKAYLRVDVILKHYATHQIQIEYSLYLNEEYAKGGAKKIAIIDLVPLLLRKEPQESDWGIPGRDANGSQPKDAGGKPIVVQLRPALPSIDEFMSMSKELGDERAAAYELIKKLEFVKQCNPVDLDDK